MMGAFDSDMMAEIMNQSDANSGWVRLRVPCIDALSGTIDLRAFNARACKGEAAISIRTNMPGKVPYQLRCSGGRNWSHRVVSHKTGPNTYLGVAVWPFKLKKNEHVNCALKTRMPLPVKTLALKGRQFSCFKPTVDQPSSSFVSDPKPPSSPPRRCTERWKQVCKNVPKRTCKNVIETKCVRVPKLTCKRVGKKTCRPITRRVCRRVGSTNRQVCRTVTRRQCFRTVARECKRTWARSCGRTVDRKCNLTFRRQCERKREVICNR